MPGGTVGPTLFLPPGVFRLLHHPGYALVLLLLFMLPVSLALFLWRHRQTLQAYTAMQILLPVIISAVFVGALIFYWFGITIPAFVDRSVTVPVLVGIPVSYVVIALFFRFHHQHHRPVT
jgi:hypothetical protein